jgi:nucleotide-binding universal stress UspA family protein
MPFRRILVPVDYSDNSKAAVLAAVALAKELGGSLDLVHVWDRPTYVTDAVMVRRPGEEQRSLAELIRANAEKDMEEFLAGLPLPSDVVVTHRLVSGEPASTLIAELNQRKHDLVILSTHGRTGLLHLLLGSVAEKLIRFSPVPVLTVPSPERAG